MGNILRLPYRQRLTILLNEFGAGARRPRRGPAPGHPQRRPGAEGDRPRPRDPGRARTRCWPSWPRTPTRRSRRWRPTATRSPTSSSRRTRPPRPRPSAATTSRPASSSLPATSCAQLKPTLQRSSARSSDQFDAGARRPQPRRARRQPLHQAARAVLARPATPALQSLGERRRRRAPGAAQEPRRSSSTCGEFATAGKPLAAQPQRATASLKDTGGIERLMDFLFYSAAVDQRLRLDRPLPARAAADQPLQHLQDRQHARTAARTSSSREAPRRGRGVDRRSAALGARPASRGRGTATIARRAAPAAPAATAAPRRPRRGAGHGALAMPTQRPAVRRRVAGRAARSAPRAPPAAAAAPLRRRHEDPARLPAGAAHEAPQLGLHRREPRAHRRGDDARHPRRGLPRLQRELGPAVRPDLLAEGRRAQRGATSSWATRSASAARASAWSTRSTPGQRPRRPRHRRARRSSSRPPSSRCPPTPPS